MATLTLKILLQTTCLLRHLLPRVVRIILPSLRSPLVKPLERFNYLELQISLIISSRRLVPMAIFKQLMSYSLLRQYSFGPTLSSLNISSILYLRTKKEASSHKLTLCTTLDQTILVQLDTQLVMEVHIFYLFLVIMH